MKIRFFLLFALGAVMGLGCGGSSADEGDMGDETAGDESMGDDGMGGDGMGGDDMGGDDMGGETAASDIVDTAVAAGQFSTLVAAVQAAELEDTLRGPGPFTVFAPTDEAFAALPEGTVDELLLPENRDRLVSILTYHVVPGAVMSDQVVGMTEAETVQGTMLPISTEGGGVMVGEATVVQPDVQASNGVIHVIDAVLIPAE
jgi:uncharacterized surface protein with fasciclin (FAS1) repeats